MAIHQAGDDDTAAGVDATIGLHCVCFEPSRQIGTAADPLDVVITNQHGAILDFTTGAIHGDQDLGIFHH